MITIQTIQTILQQLKYDREWFKEVKYDAAGVDAVLETLINSIEKHLQEQKPLTENEQEQRGIAIANMLGLRAKKGDWKGYRYFTTWGSKTALGLYRTMSRWFEPKLDDTCREEIEQYGVHSTD